MTVLQNDVITSMQNIRLLQSIVEVKKKMKNVLNQTKKARNRRAWCCCFQ